MFKGLWLKFFVLLLAVAAIALAASFTLRGLMVRDFRNYEQGQLEDRVYWVIASLESSYEKNSAWSREAAAAEAVRALMMGFDIRLFDNRRVFVTDTTQSLKTLSPLMQKRLLALSQAHEGAKTKRFFPYPLFLNGTEIGTLEVSFPQPEREAIFVRRSDLFLLLSVAGLGGAAFILSVFFARRLTSPLKKLAAAAEGVIDGDLQRRVSVPGQDEIARLSAAFNRMTGFLEAQEGLRKKLISNVSHEIRTPLAAIRGELAGMIDGLIPAHEEELRSLYEETCRLEGLLDGMEELSRAQAGAVFIHRHPVKLSPVLDDIKKTFSGVSSEKGASIDILCPDGLDLYADQERLRQVMVNLVSNALKAVDENGKISIRAGKNGATACIEVEDNGCGIDRDALPFIFERFFKSSEGGIGIGLAIVKELVDAHGGRIEVASEKGKGTVFKVFIPDIQTAQ